MAPSSSPSPCVFALSEQPLVNPNLPDIVPDCESEFKMEPDADTSSSFDKSESSECSASGAGQLEDPLLLQILNDLLADDGSSKSLLSPSAQVSPATLTPVGVDVQSSRPHQNEYAMSLALAESCSGSTGSWECADALTECESLHSPVAKVQLLEQPLAFAADVPFSLANLDELDMFALDDLPAPLELI